MNINKILASIFVILLAYSVKCDDADDIKSYGLNKAKQRYRYNHPPSFESYESIPVAIVYDKVIDRTSRRQKTVKPVTETDLKVSSPVHDTVPVTTKLPILKNVAIITTTAKNEIETKKIPESRQIRLEFKVPVSVVYDEQPEVVKKNRAHSEASSKRMQNSNRRRSKYISQKNELVNSVAKQPEQEQENEKSTVKPVSSDSEKTLSIKSTQVEMPKSELSSTKEPAILLKRTNQLRQTDSNQSKIPTENASQVFKQSTTIETSTLEESTQKTNEKKRKHGEADPIVPIVASENYVFTQNGEFKYSYESGDGTKAFSQGKLKTFDENVTGESVEGGFSYKDKDGKDVSLSYTADENGYRPVGAHLPTPPPIPPAIARALAYLATKPTPETVTEAIDEYTPVPNQNDKKSPAQTTMR